ncbi:MAG: NfeD family protein, partial [Calditrichia bacterium]
VLLIWVFLEIIEHLLLPVVSLFKKKDAVQKEFHDMTGQSGRIEEWKNFRGRIFVRGEYWDAQSSHSFRPGQQAIVKEQIGMELYVEPPSAKDRGGV